MTIVIEAVFDGKVFVPIKPLDIEPDTPVKISVQTDSSGPYSFLDVAQSIDLDGPPDWATKLDEYLYGGKSLDGS